MFYLLIAWTKIVERKGNRGVDFCPIIITLSNWFNHLQFEIEPAENTRIAAIFVSAKEKIQRRIPHSPTPAQPADQPDHQVS